MDFINNYGDQGYSSWEIPQLISGETTMISDADGRNYPFYGSNSELIELYGPSADYRRIQVRMNDNFYPHITWDIPTSNERVSRLTHVRREQHFYTWLVAMNAHNGSILVLKTIQWQMNLEIDVNPKQIQGSRAKLISNPIPIQPIILKDNVRIPSTVLYPPNVRLINSVIQSFLFPCCRQTVLKFLFGIQNVSMHYLRLSFHLDIHLFSIGIHTMNIIFVIKLNHLCRIN